MARGSGIFGPFLYRFFPQAKSERDAGTLASVLKYSGRMDAYIEELGLCKQVGILPQLETARGEF